MATYETIYNCIKNELICKQFLSILLRFPVIFFLTLNFSNTNKAGFSEGRFFWGVNLTPLYISKRPYLISK